MIFKVVTALLVATICVLARKDEIITVGPPPILPHPDPVEYCFQKYEVYLNEGPGCPQDCKNLNQDCYASEPNFVTGCYCIPGYVRNKKGICVDGNSFCGNCSKHEFYTENGSPCQTECATLGQKCTIVNIMAPRGCYCQVGYARNDKRKCIAVEKCKGI